MSLRKDFASTIKDSRDLWSLFVFIPTFLALFSVALLILFLIKGPAAFEVTKATHVTTDGTVSVTVSTKWRKHEELLDGEELNLSLSTGWRLRARIDVQVHTMEFPSEVATLQQFVDSIITSAKAKSSSTFTQPTTTVVDGLPAMQLVEEHSENGMRTSSLSTIVQGKHMFYIISFFYHPLHQERFARHIKTILENTRFEKEHTAAD